LVLASAFTAPAAMDGDYAAAGGTGEPVLFSFHEDFQPMFPDEHTVVYKARSISCIVALLKIFDSFTGIVLAFMAIDDIFFSDTILDFAFPAMFRFSRVSPQTAFAGLFMSAMCITDHAVHTARSEHDSLDNVRHLHWPFPFWFGDESSRLPSLASHPFKRRFATPLPRGAVSVQPPSPWKTARPFG
jgi:hypothetical protein